jgi:hypothetical protein
LGNQGPDRAAITRIAASPHAPGRKLHCLPARGAGEIKAGAVSGGTSMMFGCEMLSQQSGESNRGLQKLE